MSEKRWTDDERSEAFERGLKTMEGVALELYRRGREEAREELETVKRERDEARAEVGLLREMAHDFEAMREDRDSAYRRGAEAMREACARWIAHKGGDERIAWQVGRLPIPEEP